MLAKRMSDLLLWLSTSSTFQAVNRDMILGTGVPVIPCACEASQYVAAMLARRKCHAAFASVAE